MAHIGKLKPLLNKARRAGWLDCVTDENGDLHPSDEHAILNGCYFDPDKALHFEYYCFSKLRLTKGEWAGKPFEFMDWQRDRLFNPLFGWMNEEGFRRFRRAYIELPKKNTKSTAVSAIGLYMMDPEGDGEPAAECYALANDRDQATLVWSPAADMVEESPELKSRFEVTRSTKVISYGTKSFFKAWSAEARTKDGPDIHFCSTDELHAWKGQARDLWSKIKHAGIARRQPLCPFTITNSGNDKTSLCHEQHEYAEKIIEARAYNDEFFALLYNADKAKLAADPDYWKTPACHKQVNPCYGITLRAKDFDVGVTEAEDNPAEESTFKQFRCGIWVDSVCPWVPSHIWDKNAELVPEEKLKGRHGCAALDLSSTTDLSALAMCFPLVNEKYAFWLRVFCPADTILKRSQEDNVRYDLWRDQGFLIATPGDVIDYNFIFKEIDLAAQMFNIDRFAFDRWGSSEIIQKVQDRGLEVVPFGQGFKDMSPPTKDLLKILKQGRVCHGDHPVLKMAAANAEAKNDEAENTKLVKRDPKKRIDPLIAAIMAYGTVLRLEDEPESPYKTRGIRSV